MHDRNLVAMMNSTNITRYKNAGKVDECRRRREEEGVVLRKQKRGDQIAKRRNLTVDEYVVELAEGGDTVGVSEIETAGPSIARDMLSSDPDVQLTATRKLRVMVSKDNSPLGEEIGSLIPLLVKYLSSSDDFPAMQHEVTWILTNICSGTTDQVRAVVEAGAVPFLVALLRSPSNDVRIQSLWALGNICGDCAKFRDMTIEQGVIPALLWVLNSTPVNPEMARVAVWVISNFCRNRNGPPAQFSQVSVFIPVLFGFLGPSNASQVVADACWAFSYLLDGPPAQIQAVIEHGITRTLVELVTHVDPEVARAAVRCVGNIVQGDSVQTQVALNCGAIEFLHLLLVRLGEGDGSMKMNVTWALSNICAGTESQVQAIIDKKVVPDLVKLLRQGDFRIRKEAAWAISNITKTDKREHIRYVTSCGVIRPLCDVLMVNDTDMVKTVLQAIEKILAVSKVDAEAVSKSFVPAVAEVEACNGHEKIEFLQQHENNEIYQLAFDIMGAYFSDEDDAPSPTLQSLTTPNPPHPEDPVVSAHHQDCNMTIPSAQEKPRVFEFFAANNNNDGGIRFSF